MAIIVVTGIARGGTTFAGQVIAEATGRPTQAEILNPNDYPVPQGFQTWQAEPPFGYLRWYFEDVMKPRAVLKDPFVAPYVQTIYKHWTKQIVAMVRHPAAVAHSFARMNWNPGTSHLPIPQHEARYLRVAALYQHIYSHLLAAGVPIFRAEDLARNPQVTMTRILDSLGEDGDPTVADKYLDSKFGTQLGGKMHVFQRSPEAMDNWKRSPMRVHLEEIMAEAPVANTWY